MNNVDDLIIYKQYIELIYYVENITIKYPKVEKYSIVSQIKNNVYDGMKLIIRAQKEYDKNKRLVILNELDVDLRMLNVLGRISYKKKFISVNNYKAWCKKTNNIGNLLGGWIKSCVRQ